MPHERRQFIRVVFATHAALSIPGGSLEVQVLDLSLKGALVVLPEGIVLAPGTRCRLAVPLVGNAGTIEMRVETAYQEARQLGLHCLDTDLDSVTHLRRVIELQLGDPALLERDLRQLIAGQG